MANLYPDLNVAAERAALVDEPAIRPAKFTAKQRQWILAMASYTRGRLGTPLTDEMPGPVIDGTQSLLSRMRTQTDIHRRPNRKTIRAVWKAIWDPNRTVDPLSLKGRIRRPVGLVAIIESILEHHPDASHRKIAEFLPDKLASPSLVHLVMKKEMKLFFYRRRQVQFLREEDYVARVYFARFCLRSIHENSMRADLIIFSDEVLIGLNPHHNRQNSGKWQRKGMQDRAGQLTQKKTFSKKVHIWVGLNFHVGVIGPVFVDEIQDESLVGKDLGKTPNSLTGPKYKVMLEKYVLPEIRSKLPASMRFNSFWWQQDGASVHCTLSVMDYLASEFGTRVIARKALHEWPARSPDLSPLDYGFWSLMRKKVTDAHPNTLDEVKLAVRSACRSLNENVKRIISDFVVRLRACENCQGQHFDPWLKQYKRRLLQAGACASCAGQTDGILCEPCNQAMFRLALADRQLDAAQAEREQAGVQDDDEELMEEMVDEGFEVEEEAPDSDEEAMDRFECDEVLGDDL